MIMDHPLIVDETGVFPSIQRIIDVHFDLKKILSVETNLYSTFPTYHIFIALCLKLLNHTSLTAARLCTFFFSLLSVPVLYRVARQIDKESAHERVLQYGFFPVFVPYFFLLYTDIVSLTLVLVTLGLCLRKNYTLASISGVASVLVRQDNIVWFSFFFMFIYWNEFGRRLDPFSLAEHFIKRWIFTAGFILFGIFAVLNQGISFGDKGMHPVSTMHLGNIYFLLFIFFFLFLPFNLSNFGRIADQIRHKTFQVSLGLGVFFIIYFLTFTNDHPYNQIDRIYFLRNQILIFFTASPSRKIFFFIPIAYSALSLFVTKLENKFFYWMYPAAALFLSAAWLIEQRYYFVPLAFFMLFRERRSSWVEYSTILGYGILLIWLIHGINSNRFFL